jgi:type I restriction enzyme S subunit
MSELKEYKLSDLMEIKYGKDHKHLADGSFPLYGSGGIMRYVEKSIYEEESILIPRKGTLSNLFFVNEPFWSVDTMFWSKIKQDLVLPKYLYYTLKTYNLAELNVGSAVPSLTTEVLNKVIISIPDKNTQTSIAEILSSLDDKIELNNKINQELEDLAQTLFKRWFIDFEFPNENGDPYKSSGGEMVDSELGEIPKGWRVSEIETLCKKMNSGGTPSTKRDDYYNGDILWYSTKELQDEFLFASDRTITVAGLENSSAKIFPVNTVVMAIYAAPTVGRLGILTKEASFNQAALGFVAINEIGYEYLFLLLKYLREDLNNLANGAAQQNLNVRIVKEYKTIVPSKGTLDDFQHIINPIFKTIKNNQEEHQELTRLRETLLPKLISGELEVSQVQTIS